MNYNFYCYLKSEYIKRCINNGINDWEERIERLTAHGQISEIDVIIKDLK